ncbi:helix-turn-helix transcriptional regulator [Corynebacterium glucuronolyticum]
MGATSQRYFTIAQACEYLGVSRNTICRRIADGTLKAVQLGNTGRTIRIPLASIEAALSPVENGAA